MRERGIVHQTSQYRTPDITVSYTSQHQTSQNHTPDITVSCASHHSIIHQSTVLRTSGITVYHGPNIPAGSIHSSTLQLYRGAAWRSNRSVYGSVRTPEITVLYTGHAPDTTASYQTPLYPRPDPIHHTRTDITVSYTGQHCIIGQTHTSLYHTPYTRHNYAHSGHHCIVPHWTLNNGFGLVPNSTKCQHFQSQVWYWGLTPFTSLPGMDLQS